MAGVALVLGGASGIGAAVAEILAQQGHTVAVADLGLEAAAESAGQLHGAGHQALAVNVADESSVMRCFDEVEAALGEVRVLVVTAGVAGLIKGQRPLFRETTVESWHHVMGVNAFGTFIAAREMLRRRALAPLEHGRIITTASIVAQTVPRQAPVTYAASKGAVLAITKAAAVEAMTLGMTANAIAPGVIDTPMLREAFPATGSFKIEDMTSPMGQPMDIAAAVAFLASPQAAFVNGACIDVNGGYVMR